MSGGAGPVRACHLYHLYDVDNELLYVGVTDDVAARMRQHAAAKSWWSEVAREWVVTYPDRVSCEAAEALAIYALRPVHNLAVPSAQRVGVMTDRAMEKRPLPVEAVVTIETLTRELQNAQGELSKLRAQVEWLAWKRREADSSRRWLEGQDRRGRLHRELGEWLTTELGRVAYVEEFGGDREAVVRHIAQRAAAIGQVVERPVCGAGEQLRLPVSEFADGVLGDDLELEEVS